MNKFTLTFKSPDLEEEYQRSELQQVRFKFYLCVVLVCFIMNVSIVISNFISPTTNTWQINAGFAIFSLLQIIVYIVMKHFRYIQIAMTVTNIMVGLLELNLDPASTTQTEFFAYGNTFMQFQGIVYLLSDFHHSIIQVIGQLAARQVITMMVSNRFDYILFGTQIIAAFLITLATYMRNKTGRIFYMQSLKDTYFDQLSSFLITEPYLKIKYSAMNMMFHLTQNNRLDLFPGYDEDFCSGCNARIILRKYLLDSGEMLEKQLLNQDSIELPATVSIKYQRKTYQLRICKTDFIETSYLIILEEASQIQTNSYENVKEEKKLKIFLKQHNSLHQRFMSWGVLSVVLLKSRVLLKIDLKKILERFLAIYRRDIWKKLKVTFIYETNQSDFLTFAHQLQIFLIQFYDTLMIIQHQEKISTTIRIVNHKKYIEMNVENYCSNAILNLLNANYFFQKTQQLLVQSTVIQNNCIQFQFKKYSKQTFLISSL